MAYIFGTGSGITGTGTGSDQHRAIPPHTSIIQQLLVDLEDVSSSDTETPLGNIKPEPADVSSSDTETPLGNIKPVNVEPEPAVNVKSEPGTGIGSGIASTGTGIGSGQRRAATAAKSRCCRATSAAKKKARTASTPRPSQQQSTEAEPAVNVKSEPGTGIGSGITSGDTSTGTGIGSGQRRAPTAAKNRCCAIIKAPTALAAPLLPRHQQSTKAEPEEPAVKSEIGGTKAEPAKSESDDDDDCTAEGTHRPAPCASVLRPQRLQTLSRAMTKILRHENPERTADGLVLVSTVAAHLRRGNAADVVETALTSRVRSGHLRFISKDLFTAKARVQLLFENSRRQREAFYAAEQDRYYEHARPSASCPPQAPGWKTSV